MQPLQRIGFFKTANNLEKTPRKAAVMAVFYPDKEQNTHLLFILRKTYKGVHSNQVAFPGGKAEETDATILETALRETYEEVGVLPEDITGIKKLTSVYVIPSNFDVQPFLGLYRSPKPFVKQDAEVAALLEVSLSSLLDDTNVTIKKLRLENGEEIEVPAFNLNSKLVWGATAMMLNEIKTLLRQVL